jgi:hypothetical protein
LPKADRRSPYGETTDEFPTSQPLVTVRNLVVEYEVHGHRGERGRRLGAIEVDADPASEDAADPILVTARYDNSFVKLNGQWKFKHKKVHFHQVSDFRKGWVEQPFWEQ